MHKVCVLVSTYNGSKFVKEQMDSLLAQRGVEVNIIVRDDGSTDDTCSIIEEKYPEVELRREKNIGCEPSFMNLLHSAPEADYYAFCDQDDVWMEDKLETAVMKLDEIHGPAIYGCNLMACDRELNPIRLIHDQKSIEALRNKAGRDFVFNMHACVLVWNRELQEILRKHYPTYVAAHDTWVNTVGNAVGTMVIDETPHIYYRLHGANVSGLAKNKLERIKKGFSRYFGKNHPQRDLLAKEVLDGYEELMDKNAVAYKDLLTLANYKQSMANRIALMNSNSIRMKSMPDVLFWKLCILFGTY